METKITIEGREIYLKSKLLLEGVIFPNSTSKTLHNKFGITVVVEDVKERFVFYDSMANFENGIQDLTENGLKNALRSFIDDASFGTYSFKDFCSELGYLEDSRTAERIHKECKKSLKKLLNLGFSEREIPDILNNLAEQGIE